MTWELIFTVSTIIACGLGLSWFAGSDAPFIPTKQKSLKAVLKLAGVKKGKSFFELGSGDGRVVLQAARLGALSCGIEQSWLRVIYSKLKAKQAKLAAYFYHGNIFYRSYQNADIIYIYLLDQAVALLEQKLKKELKKGAVVITQTYHFPNWKPIEKVGVFWIYRA